MEKIILHINPKSKAGKLIKDLLSLLAKEPGVTIEDEGKSPYDPEFVEMVQKAKADKKRYAVNDVDELWESLE